MRRTGWAAVVLGVAMAALPVGAGPAWAADDEVELRMPGRITAGGAPEELTVEVHRREDGCATVSVLLVVELPGAAEGQLQASVRDDGRWRGLRVSYVAGDRFVTEPVAPDDARVCRDDHPRASVLLQVAVASDAPDGKATFVAEAYSETGDLVGRVDESLKISGGRPASPSASRSGSPSASPSPSRSPSRSPTASAGPSSAAPAGVAPAPEAPTGQPLLPAAVSGSSDGRVFGNAGTLIMGLGGVLVGLGVVLLVLLMRRRRRAENDGGGPAAATTPW